MKNLIFLLIALFVITNLFSYSMMDRESGSFIHFLDARSSSMGGAMSVGGINLFNTITNPANVMYLKNGIGLQTAFGVINDKENRALPMYDSFEAYAGDAIYASNDHLFTSFAFGNYFKKCFNSFSIVGGLIYRPLVDFNAKYEEEVRNNENSNYNNYPPIIANNYWKGTGNIYSYDLLLGTTISQKISLGIILSLLKGDNTLKRDMIWSKEARDMMVSSGDTLIDEHFKMKRNFEGKTFNFGIAYNLTKRMDIGFSYAPKSDLDVTGKINGIEFTAKDTLENPIAIWGYNYNTELDSLGNVVIVDSTAISYDDHYNPYIIPSKMRFGFQYKPRNIMRTNFHFDIEYVMWSDVNSLYDNAFNFYLGVEHKTRFYMPFRFGFSYTTNYKMNYDKYTKWASKITMPTFAVGTGFNYGNHLTINFAAQYSHRTYKALDLFPDDVYDHQELWSNYNHLNLQKRGWDNPDTVNENFLTFKTSINFVW